MIIHQDIGFILSKIPDGGLFIGGDAEVRPLIGVPPPALHEAFIEASLQDLGLAPYWRGEKLQAIFGV